MKKKKSPWRYRKTVLQLCLAATEAERLSHPVAEVVKAALSKRAKALVRVAKERWELCKDGRDKLVEGVKLLTGEDLSSAFDDVDKDEELTIKLIGGCVIVPTGHQNDHNYAIGTPIIAKKFDADDGNKDYFWRPDGSTGNHMGREYRYATPKEIRAMPDGQLKALWLELLKDS